METKEFVDKLKELIAVHSIPQQIISDDAKTFKATAKFIDKLRKSEELHSYLSDQVAMWDFMIQGHFMRGVIEA